MAADVPRPARPVSRRTQLRSRRGVQLAGLLVVTTVAIIGGRDAYRASTPVALTAAAAASDPPIGRAVTVTCTAPIVDPGAQVAGDDADEVQYLALCPLGERGLVVVSDHPVRTLALAGKLQPLTGEEVWARAQLGARYDAAYLDLTTADEDRVVAILVAALGLGALVGWVMFVRRWLLRR